MCAASASVEAAAPQVHPMQQAAFPRPARLSFLHGTQPLRCQGRASLVATCSAATVGSVYHCGIARGIFFAVGLHSVASHRDWPCGHRALVACVLRHTCAPRGGCLRVQLVHQNVDSAKNDFKTVLRTFLGVVIYNHIFGYNN